MPFIQANIKKEIEEKRKDDSELIEKMIMLRKEENITQKELAKLSGKRQQTISKIERKETVPTITAFNNLLNALGYELKIVKKQ